MQGPYKRSKVSMSIHKHITEICLKNIRRLNGDDGCLHKTRDHQEAKSIEHEETWLKLNKFNLFIGQNGCGKSTVLDMVNCIRDPRMLGTMPRENMNSHRRSYFTIRGDGVTVSVNFPNVPPQNNAVIPHGTNAYHPVKVTVDLISDVATYELDFAKFAIDDAGCHKVVFQHVPFKVHHSREADQIEVFEERHIDELNNIAHMLKGTLGGDHAERENFIEKLHAQSQLDITDKIDFETTVRTVQKAPLVFADGGKFIYMFAGDDVLAKQVISLSRIPSGWLAYARITGWLKSSEVANGSICLIEEPETHLHPALQRALIRRIFAIAADKNLQLLIASHSPIFINLATSNSDASLFRTNSMNQLEIVEVPELLLNDLGVHGSDILQANGVIWVEGESDKIYLQWWISEIVSRSDIQINLDYEICEYGGANLAHFAISDDRAFTQLRRMNQNLLVLFDKDKDFEISEDGSMRLVNTSSYKAMVWEQLAATPAAAFVTDGYTIEDYLPSAFFEKYFDRHMDGRVTSKTKRSKVLIAREFIKSGYKLDEHSYSKALINKLNNIVDCIVKWNS